MTETERKALALVNEVRAGWNLHPYDEFNREAICLHEALCRAIEQHEAFRQEVSDACKKWTKENVNCREPHDLDRFIIAKPDPLVEVISSALREGSPFAAAGSHDYTAEAKVIAAAIEARGGRIVWEGE